MSPDTTPALSTRRKWLLALITAAISAALAFLSCELLVRWLDPQATMVPRSRFSAAYGLEFHPNRTMVNELSGQWRFDYTTNAQGHRGPVLPVADTYLRPNVVALGDSFTFGFGIADGEEFPALLRERLAASHGVVNLGTGGWGLTQEIRRYHDLGQRYQPKVVVLQFAGNDPSDNLLYRVTSIEGGRFVFHDRDDSGAISVVKRFLSDSVVQRSHLYALARGHLYYLMRGREIASTAGAAAAADHTSSPAQQFHNELLDAFARELHQRGVRLLLIAVDGHLKEFPGIRARMQQLHAEGLATFIDLDELFKTAPHDRSPEGHWGPVSHRTVADALAREILNPAPRPGAPAAGK